MAGEAIIRVVGRVGSDPDLKFTNEGKAFAKFSLAVTSTKREGNEWIDQGTEWFRVTVWRGAEAVIEMPEKGALVTVEGKFRTHEWTNKNNEVKTDLVIEAETLGLVPTMKMANRNEAPF